MLQCNAKMKKALATVLAVVVVAGLAWKIGQIGGALLAGRGASRAAQVHAAEQLRRGHAELGDLSPDALPGGAGEPPSAAARAPAPAINDQLGLEQQLEALKAQLAQALEANKAARETPATPAPPAAPVPVAGGAPAPPPGKKVGDIPLHEYEGEYGKDTFDPTLVDLNVTYESCMASLEGGRFEKTLKRPIQWVHFPKCGTSFGAVVYGYVCSPEESPLHAPDGAAINAGINKGNMVNGTVCNYCNERAVTSNKPTLWDPHLRKTLPYRAEDRGGKMPPFKYCDWNVRSPPPPHLRPPCTRHDY